MKLNPSIFESGDDPLNTLPYTDFNGVNLDDPETWFVDDGGVSYYQPDALKATRDRLFAQGVDPADVGDKTRFYTMTPAERDSYNNATSLSSIFREVGNELAGYAPRTGPDANGGLLGGLSQTTLLIGVLVVVVLLRK